MLWLVAWCGDAGAGQLTRGPYLQLLTPHGVTVVWDTDAPGACAVSVGPADGASTVASGGRGTACAVAVDGLAPGHEYAYVPLADGQPLDTPSTFHTDDPARPFTFLAVGDSGTGGPNQARIRDRMLESPADFVLSTGDMVYDSGRAEDFDRDFFVPYRALVRRLVFWPLRGNHDVRTDKGAPWRAAFWTPANNPAHTEDYYSFDYGNAHLVVLDSNAPLTAGTPQAAFLDADLAASTARWKIVALHHTLYSSGKKHGSNLPLRAALVPVFDRHGVDLVLMGHEHDYERTVPLRGDVEVAPGAGTVYVTTGGGGKGLHGAGHSSFTAYADSVFHFVRIAVRGDTLTLEMIRDDGTIPDRATLTKPAPAVSTTTTTRAPS